MYKNVKQATFSDGRVNPKYLLGKTIYNFWIDNEGYIILTIKDTWERFKIKGYEVRLFPHVKKIIPTVSSDS